IPDHAGLESELIEVGFCQDLRHCEQAKSLPPLLIIFAVRGDKRMECVYLECPQLNIKDSDPLIRGELDEFGLEYQAFIRQCTLFKDFEEPFPLILPEIRRVFQEARCGLAVECQLEQSNEGAPRQAPGTLCDAAGRASPRNQL